MLTFALQCLVTLCVLVFGCLALLVARHPGTNAFHRAAWITAGVAFAEHGVNKGIQNVWGFAALRAGAGSPVLESYLLWMPAFNHSRTMLMVGMCLVLGALCVRRTPPDRRFWIRAGVTMLVGLLAGATLGVLEKGFAVGPHHAAVAVLDVVELLVVLATLFALLVTNRTDRHLWSGLAFYACSIALSTFWFSALSAWGTLGAWTPPVWSTHVMRLVTHLLLVGFAARRLYHVRRGVAVGGFMDARRPVALSMMH